MKRLTAVSLDWHRFLLPLPTYFITMKKILIVLSAVTFMLSCGSNNSDANNNAGGATTSTDATTPATGTDAPATTGANADADKGLELIAASDCLTCHKVEEKLVGPAYREVAKKYANEPAIIDSLASKIIHGGAGNWGQIAMTPHPQISREDAQTMVKYIMSLKQ
jgi:cytochrome c